MSADGGFSPVGAGEKGRADGPGSNTGQKGPGALIDFCTFVVSRTTLGDRGLSRLQNLVDTVFSSRGDLQVGAIRERSWQFYPVSAVIIDREGECVGRIGVGGSADTVCVSLSGAGCRYVTNWHAAGVHLEAMRAKLTRVDVAFDDYDGSVINVHDMRARAQAGDFAEGGRPPRHRFVSDEGHGTGSTLYVGGKGHKELCVYEKGKQLGLPTSPWTRAEVRLYAKHTAIPFDVLLAPLVYLRGAYTVLRSLGEGLCERLKTTKRAVAATGAAMVEFLRRQVGPSLSLIRECFGSEWTAFLDQRVVRYGRPGRFRGISGGDELIQTLRSELCLAS